MIDKEQEKINNLKIGDTIFTFRSELINKYKPFFDYSFFEISGETKYYWKLGKYMMVRKTDLKLRGEDFTYLHVMNEQSIEMRRKREEYETSLNKG